MRIKTDEEIDELTKEVLSMIAERERLILNAPKCEKCESDQVQLLSTCNQTWKCRHCGTEMMTLI